MPGEPTAIPPAFYIACDSFSPAFPTKTARSSTTWHRNSFDETSPDGQFFLFSGHQ